MKSILSITVIILSINYSFSQNYNLPTDIDKYHTIDRIELLNDNESFNTSIKPYSFNNLNALIRCSNIDEELLIKEGLNETKLKNKGLYKDGVNFLTIYDKNLSLNINPLIYSNFGIERGSVSQPIYRNSRGLEVSGNIMKKLGFYTSVLENQIIFPSYIDSYISKTTVIPHVGFWKRYKENGVDYFLARSHIKFNLIEPINLEFGYDNQFIGNGFRSMILSDFAPPSLYLKLTTNIWKLNYTNLFKELTAEISTSGGIPNGNEVYPKKYLALHHLNLKINKNLDIGLFESVIFQRNDSMGMELNYLNPLIFYRAVEQNLGSPDNALLGLDFRWKIKKGLAIYGQLVLDELIVKEVFSGDGWWGNKQSGQFGIKYYNALGMKNLDLQGEFNIARPYMYSHTEGITNYSHYLQALAHPLGANFHEIVGVANYQISNKLKATAQLIYSKYGSDTTGTNYGKGILLANANRPQDYDNKIGQGFETKLLLADLNFSYQLRSGLFIDLRQVIRKEKTQDLGIDLNTYFMNLGIRMHIGRSNFHF